VRTAGTSQACKLACLITNSADGRHGLHGMEASPQLAGGKPSLCTHSHRLSRAAACECITRLSLYLAQCQTCARTDALRQQVGIVAAQLAPAAVGNPKAVSCVPLLVRYQAMHPRCSRQKALQQQCASKPGAQTLTARSPQGGPGRLRPRLSRATGRGSPARHNAVTLLSLSGMARAARESARESAAQVRAHTLTSTVSIVNRLLDSLSTAISPGTVATPRTQCASAKPAVKSTQHAWRDQVRGKR